MKHSPTTRSRRPRHKTGSPVSLDGATAFSVSGELNPIELVRLMKAHPAFSRVLLDGTRVRHRWGRRRIEGSWALAYLAFVTSGLPDIQPWWIKTSDELWRECGFTASKDETSPRPSYDTTYARFCELEDDELAGVFRDAAGVMIRHAHKRSGGLVGRDLHVDSTESETNARLRHVCPSGSPCWGALPSFVRRARPRTAEVHLSAVKEDRQREADRPEDEVADTEVLLGDGAEGLTETSGRRLVKLKNGCVYELLDPTAGVRAYTGARGSYKFWVGFYNQKLIDHYTGAPIAVVVDSASVPEWRIYPQTLEQGIDALGHAPRAIAGDRGFSLSSVFQLNTEHGVASVFPWRARHHSHTRADDDQDRWDRHGVVRCKHCGGPTRFVRFNEANPKPRLWVQCEMRPLATCDKAQTISCAEDWRMLIPMWRTDPVYHALRASHQRYERVHDHWRKRWRVAGDEHQLRPKRRGRACQQLRAWAAMCCEWLLILWREGWLGSARRHDGDEKTDDGSGAVFSLTRRRARLNLHLPYGPAAIAAGIGGARPGEPPPPLKT